MEPYEAREIAAKAWCDNSTSHLDMIPELAEAFAKILVEEVGKASPASAPEGFAMTEPTLLPDGSGFGIMSFPLPKDHWIYKEREYEDGAIEPNDLPAPILTHSFRRQVIAAIRYAVRSATNCGKEDDFDPDALVQNAVYALCGPYGKAAAPTPPSTEDRKDAERFRFMLDDHAEKTTRQRVRELFERLPVMSLSAARAAIDDLLKGE